MWELLGDAVSYIDIRAFIVMHHKGDTNIENEC